MVEIVVDQGTVWWPPGLPAQEQVRVVFNISVPKRPTRMTCQDYETREPVEIEVIEIEQHGTREWARYTAAIVRFLQPTQRGRSFRWRVYGEG